AAAVIQVAGEYVRDYYVPRHFRTPYHTSTLSGIGWVHELLAGHPQRIRNELGVHRGTFTILIKAMEAAGLGPSRHVSLEEQLSIFLY
ncbi:hypothetical protein F5888DRAFT_1595820, partial [Russula emetica]